jgi:hypothetical protein
VGPRAGLDAVANRETPYPCQESNPARPAPKIQYKTYEGCLKSSWTGGNATLLCCYAFFYITAAHCRWSADFSNGLRKIGSPVDLCMLIRNTWNMALVMRHQIRK